MQAATVEVLVTKGKFDPQIAIALAEAIDMAIKSSQLVTVPILDARMAAVDARFDAMEARISARFTAVEAGLETKLHSFKCELVRWVFLVMLGNVALSAGATAVLNALQR